MENNCSFGMKEIWDNSWRKTRRQLGQCGPVGMFYGSELGKDLGIFIGEQECPPLVAGALVGFPGKLTPRRDLWPGNLLVSVLELQWRVKKRRTEQREKVVYMGIWIPRKTHACLACMEFKANLWMLDSFFHHHPTSKDKFHIFTWSLRLNTFTFTLLFGHHLLFRPVFTKFRTGKQWADQQWLKHDGQKCRTAWGLLSINWAG